MIYKGLSAFLKNSRCCQCIKNSMRAPQVVLLSEPGRALFSGVPWCRVGRLRLGRSWFMLAILLRAAPRANSRRHPRKSALFALRGKQVSPAPANFCGFRSQVGGGSCRPPCLGCMPGLSARLAPRPPRRPIVTRVRFVMRSGRVVRVLALAVRA